MSFLFWCLNKCCGMKKGVEVYDTRGGDSLNGYTAKMETHPNQEFNGHVSYGYSKPVQYIRCCSADEVQSMETTTLLTCSS